MPNEERSAVDLSALVRGLAARMSDDPRFVAVTFAVDDGAKDVATVIGVSHRLESVFAELLENAASFASHGLATGGTPTVTVGLRRDRGVGQIVVTVTDTGPGIAEDDLPRVFTRFFTTRGRQRGTGLGLALVKAVVQAHGGTVGVRSKAGAGALFEVQLPAR